MTPTEQALAWGGGAAMGLALLTAAMARYERDRPIFWFVLAGIAMVSVTAGWIAYWVAIDKGGT